MIHFWKSGAACSNLVIIRVWLRFCLFNLMLYGHGKQLRSCWIGQLLNHIVPWQASGRQFTSI